MAWFTAFFLALAYQAFAEDAGKGKGEGKPEVFYSPLRPPSIPLAVRSTYTSAWSTTENGSTLNSRNVTFWNGNPIGWGGIARVDGQSYEYMGDSSTVTGLKKAIPLTVSYDSHYSNFTFDAGPVRLAARFFSPVLPENICQSSIPMSYLEVSFESTDSQPHDVELYSDVNGMWLANGTRSLMWNCTYREASGHDATCVSDELASDTVFRWQVGIDENSQWRNRVDDFPQWGKLHYASSRGYADESNFLSGSSYQVRQLFSSTGRLEPQSSGLNQTWQPIAQDGIIEPPVFAFAHQFYPMLSGSVLYTVGTTQDPAVNYLTSKGEVELRPWWSSYGCLYTEQMMIGAHYWQYETTQSEAAQWEAQLKADVASYYAAEKSDIDTEDTDCSTSSEEESYLAILMLSLRQVLASNVLTFYPDFMRFSIFQKEISSDGRVNTADVIYPALPFYLYANPEMLRLLLEPVFDFQESGLYQQYGKFAMHDIGREYPNAIGYSKVDDYRDEQMPVEESANMIIMAYAYYKASLNATYLESHYPILHQWAEYLVEHSLYPEHQTTTDDFNSPLANQTNLAIKAIIALDSMSHIANATAHPIDSISYHAIARTFFTAWRALAFDPSDAHTMLTYNSSATSYNILYNIFPALLLDLDVIPKEIYLKQSDFYPLLATPYGVPLDDRYAWTKSDWEMWSAASAEPETRAMFVCALAKWINETSTWKALTDHYMTTGTGGYTDYDFVARPVVGGHFAMLAMQKMGRNNALRDMEGGT